MLRRGNSGFTSAVDCSQDARPRLKCPTSAETGVRDAPKSVSDIRRQRRPSWAEIRSEATATQWVEPPCSCPEPWAYRAIQHGHEARFVGADG